MCNSTISLSRSAEEIVQDIKKSVNSFLDSDEVKKMYNDYLDAIFTEARDECIASNTPLKGDIQIEKEKVLLRAYHRSVGFITYVEGHAKTFDGFMKNPLNLSSEQIEAAMYKCLEHEHMKKALTVMLSNTEQREQLKLIVKCLMQKDND